MTRLLFISASYPPHHHGGYELTCRDVAEGFVRRGHQVAVLTGSRLLPGVTEVDGTGVEVRRELRVSFDGERFVHPPVTRRLAAEKANQAILREAVDAFRPDVVSAWHMAGVPLGLLSAVAGQGIPLVCVVCDEWPVYVTMTDSWHRLWRWSSRVQGLVERATGVPTAVPALGDRASFCFTSHDTRDRCLKSSPWFFPRSTVTYSGIDTDAFPVTRDRRARPWSGRLLAAGRLDPRKGFATAIRALSLLPVGTRLEIVSAADGAYRAELEAVARRAGVPDRVVFMRCDREGLRERYLAADAVLFPSEWAEPFGLVPLEAMACGAPVVATGTGGSGEFLIDGSTCVRFTPGDHAGLAGAVRRLQESPQLRERLVTAGWDMACELSASRMIDAMEEWHLAAAEGFAGGVPRPRDIRPFKPLRHSP